MHRPLARARSRRNDQRLCGLVRRLLPTAAELAGVPLPAKIDGLSLKPLLTGAAQAQPKHQYLYWEFYEGRSAQAVREQRWKGVCQPMGGTIELYDLQLDPKESNNVAAAHADVVARIRAEMDEAHVPSPLWKIK